MTAFTIIGKEESKACPAKTCSDIAPGSKEKRRGLKGSTSISCMCNSPKLQTINKFRISMLVM